MPGKTSIISLPLPDAYPADEAIKSAGQTLVMYEPEFWEFEYQVQRHLQNVDVPTLLKRYADIAKNLAYLVSEDKHRVPLGSFLSSWYWYRKEFHTRLELYYRGLDTPVPLPMPSSIEPGGPQRPRYANAADILYRYGSEHWITQLVNAGSLRMWHAVYYANLEEDPARRDDEMKKDAFLHGPSTTITTIGGGKVPIIGDVKKSHTGPDYYLLCMACDWDPKLFNDFGGTTHCAVLSDVDQFSERLQQTAAVGVPGWFFWHGPVQYFDPYERHQNEHIDHVISKDFRFAFQREYRFWLIRQGAGSPPREYVDLKLGCLQDIFATYQRPQ